jgi:DNA topoisomerase-1
MQENPLKNLFAVTDLRNRILFTLALLGVYRIGSHIPTPGVNTQALAILAQPKMRRGQTARPPLKDLGPDPDTERPIIVKEGRFGLYVTDGETNASLRKGDSVEELTMERALELLADRRAAGPSKKKAAAKKKAPAKKKAAAKKKAPAKKAAAKKAPAKAAVAED